MSVVERSLHIDAAPSAILPLLVDLRNWRQWSPWEGLDPDLRREYSGPDAGVGSKYAWQGNRKAGAGTMTIIESTDDSVDVQVDFTKPFPSKSVSSFRLADQQQGTLVTWTMTSPDTLMTRIAGKIMNFDKMLGKDIEKGLAGLSAAATR